MMLLDNQPAQTVGALAVVTRNETFNRLLRAVLAEWKYRVTETAAEADVVLIERGLSAAGIGGQPVWLTPMPLGDELHLEVPLSLTRLYHLLEVEFYPSPRQHIRAVLDADADLQVEGVWLAAQLISLSDRGGRLSCAGHLSRGQTLTMLVTLDRQPLRLNGEVLYYIPSGDLPGREQPQVGVQFKPIEPRLCQALRHYIERLSVERACQAAGVPLHDPCLSWFELLRNPWEGLGSTA